MIRNEAPRIGAIVFVSRRAALIGMMEVRLEMRAGACGLSVAARGIAANGWWSSMQSREKSGKPRRFLCLRLPRLPTDRRRGARLQPDSGKPFVLYEKVGGALRLHATDRAAGEAGLYPGQSLSDARAMAPGLVAEKADPDGDRRAFIALCLQHMRYSPIVSADQPGNILIDITGAAHLLGGEEALLDDALSRLAARRIEASGAIASSVGAAFALARAAERLVIPPGREKQALAALPVANLRVDDEIVADLNRLGLNTIGQLFDMPRAPLSARFGMRLAERLDQALCLACDPLTPLTPAPEYFATSKLDEPEIEHGAVLRCLSPLAAELGETLERRAEGARRFELALFRVDNAVMRLEVGASAPTRRASHMIRLFENRIKDLRSDMDAGFGFEIIRLSAFDCSAALVRQTDAFGIDQDDEAASTLVDRLANRLGAQRVLRSVPLNSHLPECAVEFAPVLGEIVLGAREPEKQGKPAPILKAGERPLRLLSHPEPISVIAVAPDGPPLRFIWRRIAYRVTRASSPERIEDEWWRGKSRPARDYYRIETTEGWRFWVFRAGGYGEGAEWRLHGFFP